MAAVKKKRAIAAKTMTPDPLSASLCRKASRFALVYA
jgi:hypothetical protein